MEVVAFSILYQYQLMLGNFQQSILRLEVEASETSIREALLGSEQLRQWMAPQPLSQELPEQLQPDTTFTSWIGPIAIQHSVSDVQPNSLRLLLSQGIDGFHQWHWGDGWVQSSLEGVSLLPLNLGQTLSLLRLRQFLAR